MGFDISLCVMCDFMLAKHMLYSLNIVCVVPLGFGFIKEMLRMYSYIIIMYCVCWTFGIFIKKQTFHQPSK